MRRRPVADGTGNGPRGPNPALGGTAPSTGSITPSEPPAKTGGWRKVDDPPTPVKTKEN